jgi:AraC-like DNA-binding protein
MNPNKSILIICDNDCIYLFKNYLSAFNCTYKESLSNVREYLRLKHYDSLLLYCEISGSQNEEMILKYISASFPNLHSIAILKKTEVKISHFLGRNGIKEIIHIDELYRLTSLFFNTNNTKITLHNLNITLEDYPPLVQKILRFMEDHYLTIFTITDIAQYAGISECTIAHEFQKNNLSPPKQLLMLFKVTHSVVLLTKTNLKMKEIANLSGFTSQKRYMECFERVYRISPSEYKRSSLKNQNINTKPL